MNIITNCERKIHSACFNPVMYYGTMSDKEKARRQNKKYYSKYKYLETQNKYRKVLLVTFTSKNKNIDTVKNIKQEFLNFLKADKKIKGSYSYMWTIELGKNKNNPHLHCMIWYDDTALERIILHYQKTLKKFNLVKKWSKITEQKKATAYVLKEFSVLNKSFEDYYLARKKISKNSKQQIRFIGFSSFKQTQKVYKKSYTLYFYDYLKTDKLMNFGELIFWDNKYLVKKSEIYSSIIYLLLKYKEVAKNNSIYQWSNNSYINIFFTLSIKINKEVKLRREWQFPFVFLFP